MEGLTLIKKGAEAELYRGIWLGHDSIFKRRVRKDYRNPDLDSYIRGSRTSLEAKLLRDARRQGVPTPVVYFVNRQDYEIVMSYLPGQPMKKLVQGLSDSDIRIQFERIGEMVALLHRGGIVHGDLTTSNIIPIRGDVFFIDFGLGGYTQDLEARGVDVHLMRRALESSHHEVSGLAYESFINGYIRRVGDDARAVLDRVNEIRRRGRYVEGGR